MATWEYEKASAVQVTGPDPFEPDGEMRSVEVVLSELGAAGWELVEARQTDKLHGPHPVVDLYLKRPRSS